MKRIIYSAIGFAFIGSVAYAQGFNTTGGYGNPVLDTKGAGYVNTDGLKATYSYQINDFTSLVASATDVVVLTGSATKTVKVTQVCVGGDATAAAVYDVYLYKHTIANTGGTATNPAAVKHDSLDVAATATLSLYTANPTIDTTKALLRGGHAVLVNGTTPAWANPPTCWQFGSNMEEKLTLRGVAQELAISHGGGTVPSGASMYYTITWTEE